jgi:hypothetical protein
LQRHIGLIIVFLCFLFLFPACNGEKSTLVAVDDGQLETPVVLTLPSIPTPTPTLIQTPTVNLPDYSGCGIGLLVDVPFFFTDNNGTKSPTQLMRIQKTSDNVRTYASLVTCLLFDEGWQSKPEEVVNGYENVVIFFDKFGKGHQYRIIIGGHYVAPWEPGRADIISSLNGVDYRTFSVDGWIKATNEKFISSGVRQIGVNLYISDTQGNLSKVFDQTYKFHETNELIEQALLSGEGYPDEVPEGFFLFATESWLIEPE